MVITRWNQDIPFKQFVFTRLHVFDSFGFRRAQGRIWSGTGHSRSASGNRLLVMELRVTSGLRSKFLASKFDRFYSQRSTYRNRASVSAEASLTSRLTATPEQKQHLLYDLLEALNVAADIPYENRPRDSSLADKSCRFFPHIEHRLLPGFHSSEWIWGLWCWK